MSWLYSRALVAAYSAGASSDGEPSAPSSATPTPPACYSHGRTTARWPRSLSGMTCEPLPADRGAAVLTWFLAAFRVKTLASPAQAPALTARAQDCGASTLASWARYDRDSSAWKTRQLSLLEASTACSATWPRWGTMRSGECWERTPLEHLIGVKESGSWDTYPTPTASDASHSCKSAAAAMTEARRQERDRGGVKSLAILIKTQALIPTPTAGDAKSSGSRNVEGSRAHAGVSLTDFVRDDGGRGRWPTPTAQDAANNGSTSQLARQMPPLNAVVGGALNPRWVEWLMGWPLGWTDLGPWETDKCRSVPPLHSTSLQPAPDCQSVEMLTSLHSPKSKAKTARTRMGRGAQPPGPQTNRPPAIPKSAPPVQ